MTPAALAPMAPLAMKPVEDRVPIDPEKLRALREAKGLTYTEMATACGGVENTYRAIERGDRDPKMSQVLGILKVLGLHIRDLPKIVPEDLLF